VRGLGGARVVGRIIVIGRNQKRREDPHGEGS